MGALERIEHVVVVMLENRSFDLMLGFLTLEAGRTDVDGPRPGDGVPRLTSAVSPADPCHSWDCISEQLSSEGRAGFVSTWRRMYPGVPWEAVAGYYARELVPTYAFLAEEYCVCDAWYASVPGPAWPNRLYALCGTSLGHKRNAPPPAGGFRMPSIFEYLERAGRRARYYSKDVAFLRVLERYAAHRGEPLAPYSAFLADARQGTLPAFAWVDPNFGAFNKREPQDDDHPPASIRGGQRLVAEVYDALTRDPEQWKRTLLIVTYDEHGGFADRQRAPRAPDDSRSAFRRYGVRVPAFLVSPWVARRSVCKTLFDHTSILRTVLERFCRTPEGGVPSMTERVDAAASLAGALTLEAPREDVPRANALAPAPSPAISSAPPAFAVGDRGPKAALLNDLQRDLQKIGAEAMARGVPADQL